MAKKPSLQYECAECGAVFSSWSGRCATCGQWNTLQERIDVAASLHAKKGHALNLTPLKELVTAHHEQRILTGINDVDTVLGGGVVAGSVTLLAGEPGIGKSTLLMQIAAAASTRHKVAYISGEESAHQVALRANRLGVGTAGMSLAATNSANDIAETIQTGGYDLVIVDSIQTISVLEIASAQGSVSQITNSTQLLTAAAKHAGTALLLVGHVTKEGSIAGPKVLEHTVDTVLQLEGDRYGGFKLLRAVKNRFGSTGETAIFEMDSEGLTPVLNPSAALLAERQVADGSIVCAHMEGSRALLVEIQALVSDSSFGYAKRAASGFDLNRLNLLIAMLQKRTKLQLNDKDIYINVVGGIRLNEPAADLAVAMAIASAAKGMKLKEDAVVFGELGLSGEVRHVPFSEVRYREATKLGFTCAIGPVLRGKHALKDKHYLPVGNIRDALNTYIGK